MFGEMRPGVEGYAEDARGIAWRRCCAVLPHDGFHAVLDVEFAFLEADFFELLVVGQVMLGFELVQAIVE